ncbi:hypothetical protein [Acinetobacter sp. ANC 4641]|uniref:hypothetical protein n=1 Tax=Acinetobacter sp. ANC 4641 TaxID=2529847 RepID=UPI00103E24F9|nr:hypothetical protein [Acinetobacter sp. ANC 4641]TCB12648.1 hypothetical protein E0H78_05535 [Acinetobacter sp. ANC 4641]
MKNPSQQFRHEVCLALIASGVTSGKDIIPTATAIENFVFGKEDTPVTEKAIEISEQKSAQEDNAVVEQIIKKAESVTEVAEQTEEAKVTFDEVKAVLMQVAKRNRGQLIEILAKFGTDKVNALNEADYSAVIKLADEVLGGAHA